MMSTQVSIQYDSQNRPYSIVVTTADGYRYTFMEVQAINGIALKAAQDGYIRGLGVTQGTHAADLGDAHADAD